MLDSGKDHPRFRATIATMQLIDLYAGKENQTYILDVGGGNGVHTNFFRERGFSVDLVDIAHGIPDRAYVGDFLDFSPPRRYDIVWASHVLEHVPNPGMFIRQMVSCAKEDGMLCITVPPAKPEMTFGHVTQWSAGLLLINLIKAGVDCTEARILTHGYNISIITPVRFRKSENYIRYLPKEIPVDNGYFPGEIKSLNWIVNEIPGHLRIQGLRGELFHDVLAQLRGSREGGFVLCKDESGSMKRFHWYDAALERLVVAA